ncbi:MAG: TrmH family RNA methyltransferase [Chitinispirillaceae bacterium]
MSQSKVRRESGFFLIEGKRAVEQVLSQHENDVDELLCTEEMVVEYENHSVCARIISSQKMSSICSSRTPQGIAAVVRIPPQVYSSQLPLNVGNAVLLLEHVQDPGNVGSLIRSAAALGYCGCILSANCADPFSPKVVQSTAGSVLSVWIRRTDDYLKCVSQLRKSGYQLISADLGGSENVDFTGLSKHVLALGSEGSGLTRGVLCSSDRVFRIPILEKAVESLNVAASGAICMFMCSGRLQLNPGTVRQG